MFTFLIVATLIFGAAYSLGNRSMNDYESVKNFDLDRYLGRWYEIARYDHRFERDMDYVTAEYILRENGKIEVVNRGYDRATGRLRESVGKAKTTSVPGHLRVSFFMFFYSDYNILALGENYDWVLIGSSSPKYLWILSRTPTLPAERLAMILNIAREHGYDTDKLIYPAQQPSSRVKVREKEYAM